MVRPTECGTTAVGTNLVQCKVASFQLFGSLCSGFQRCPVDEVPWNKQASRCRGGIRPLLGLHGHTCGLGLFTMFFGTSNWTPRLSENLGPLSNCHKWQIGNAFERPFSDSEKKDFHPLELWRETSTFTDRFQEHRSYENNVHYLSSLNIYILLWKHYS